MNGRTRTVTEIEDAPSEGVIVVCFSSPNALSWCLEPNSSCGRREESSSRSDSTWETAAIYRVRNVLIEVLNYYCGVCTDTMIPHIVCCQVRFTAEKRLAWRTRQVVGATHSTFWCGEALNLKLHLAFRNTSIENLELIRHSRTDRHSLRESCCRTVARNTRLELYGYAKKPTQFLSQLERRFESQSMSRIRFGSRKS